MSEDRNSRILSAVDAAFGAQTAFLSRLVREKSLRGREAGAQDLIEGELSARGFAVEKIPTRVREGDPRFSPGGMDYAQSWNLLARRGPAGEGRSLILNAHVDVVPEGPQGRWRGDPFSGEIAEGWLRGRGAGDMKAGLSAILFALEALKAAGFAPRGEVQIHSVVDEELTGNGAASMLAAGLTADAVLIPEPSDEKLVRANSGVIKFKVSLAGSPAHPREPESGKSAIDLALALIFRLRELEALWISRKRAHAGFEEIPNPVAFTVGTIRGGEWIASLPADCVFEGRIGFYPGERPADRQAEFESFVAEVWRTDPAFRGGPEPRVEWTGVCQPAYRLEPGGAAEAALSSAHRDARGGGPALGEEAMTCYLDATLYANHGGIPALVYGPIARNIHGVDEGVDLESLRRVTKTIALFVAEWCGLRPL